MAPESSSAVETAAGITKGACGISGQSDIRPLFIDGQLVVDNDGPHGAIERKGSVGLLSGSHHIEVGYFEIRGGNSLVLSWEGPGQENDVVPVGILSTTATME